MYLFLQLLLSLPLLSLCLLFLLPNSNSFKQRFRHLLKGLQHSRLEQDIYCLMDLRRLEFRSQPPDSIKTKPLHVSKQPSPHTLRICSHRKRQNKWKAKAMKLRTMPQKVLLAVHESRTESDPEDLELWQFAYWDKELSQGFRVKRRRRHRDIEMERPAKIHDTKTTSRILERNMNPHSDPQSLRRHLGHYVLEKTGLQDPEHWSAYQTKHRGRGEAHSQTKRTKERRKGEPKIGNA